MQRQKCVQIKHSFWGNGPKDYWAHIESISMFIAASLQFKVPICNGVFPRFSTIFVTQYKEKFGQVRVYCDLANDVEVKKAWNESNQCGEPTFDFKRKWLENDMLHYRTCYMNMVDLVPHYEDTILGAADHGWLLCHDIDELNEFIEKNETIFEYIHSSYNFKNIDEFRQKIIDVCGF